MSGKQVKHSGRAHALLSASSSGRWLSCTPSARLEEQFPESNSSEYAKEGTFAHELSELEIRFSIGLITKKSYLAQKKSLSASEFFTEEMEEETDKYVSHVRDCWKDAKEQDPHAEILIEDRIDLTAYIPEGFGSNDVVIISGNTLYVKDLKFGKGVKVSAKDNSQLKLYALGALDKHGLNFDIKNIHLEINQPRLSSVSTFELSADELTTWGEGYVKERAALAFAGQGDFVAGDHCRWCKAAVQCKANAAYNMEAVKDAFEDPDLLSDEQLLSIFEKAPAFVKWINKVSGYVQDEAVSGRKWPGFKLVEGRSNRVITDEEEARKALEEAGLTRDQFITEKLRSITDLTKLLGKKNFDSVLGPVIDKPQGKPTLVPEDDPRPEFRSLEKVREMFEDEN